MVEKNKAHGNRLLGMLDAAVSDVTTARDNALDKNTPVGVTPDGTLVFAEMEPPALARCPCGEVPDEVGTMSGVSSKHAWVGGNCCGEWFVEFRTNYEPIGSPERMALATKAWNKANRGGLRDHFHELDELIQEARDQDAKVAKWWDDTCRHLIWRENKRNHLWRMLGEYSKDELRTIYQAAARIEEG